MKLDDWYDAALADADRRGLADIRSLVETLAKACRALREADWNDDPQPAADRRSGRDRALDRPQV